MGKFSKKLGKMMPEFLTKKNVYNFLRCVLVLHSIAFATVTFLDAWNQYPIYTPMLTGTTTNPLDEYARRVGFSDITVKFLAAAIYLGYAKSMMCCELMNMCPGCVPMKLARSGLCTSTEYDFDQLATLLKMAGRIWVCYFLNSMGEQPYVPATIAVMCAVKYLLKAKFCGNCKKGETFKPMKSSMKSMRSMKRK